MRLPSRCGRCREHVGRGRTCHVCPITFARPRVTSSADEAGGWKVPAPGWLASRAGRDNCWRSGHYRQHRRWRHVAAVWRQPGCSGRRRGEPPGHPGRPAGRLVRGRGDALAHPDGRYQGSLRPRRPRRGHPGRAQRQPRRGHGGTGRLDHDQYARRARLCRHRQWQDQVECQHRRRLPRFDRRPPLTAGGLVGAGSAAGAVHLGRCRQSGALRGTASAPARRLGQRWHLRAGPRHRCHHAGSARLSLQAVRARRPGGRGRLGQGQLGPEAHRDQPGEEPALRDPAGRPRRHAAQRSASGVGHDLHQ